MSYSVQRDFFRFASPQPGAYLDVIECENYQLTPKEISKELNMKSYRIKHVPSWRFPMLSDSSMDLLTANWVLNELNYAGILWILAQASRVIKKGGYFYIRDGYILKPGMHMIDYDDVLTRIGFERTAQLTFKNRFDLIGVPRLYQKKDERSYSFDEMVDMCLGKFASVASGGGYAYNLESAPGAKKKKKGNESNV